MPFFRRRHRRKRAFHSSRCDSQTITYFRREDFNIPNDPTGTAGGIISDNLGVFPQNPDGTGIVHIANQSAASVPYCAEAVVSKYIGVYKFDFSRWLYATFGRPFESVTADPNLWQHSLVSYFRSLRFGTATMGIERVDYGANQALLVPSTVSGSTAVSSPVPARVRLWWLRPGTHDPSFDPVLLTPETFRGHPRARFAWLRPRGKIKFRFHPVCFMPPRYTAALTRTSATTGGGLERDRWRRAELPSKTLRLGYLPTSFVHQCFESSRSTPTPTVRFSGVSVSMNRILSPSIYFMWEEDQIGTRILNAPYPDPTTILPLNGVLVRRWESCSVTFRGLIPFYQQSWWNGSSYQPTCGMGAVETTRPYNTTVDNTVRPTIEACDVPRSRDILVDPGEDPLYRFGNTDLGVYDLQEIPVDTLEGIAPPNALGVGALGPQQNPAATNPS